MTSRNKCKLLECEVCGDVYPERGLVPLCVDCAELAKGWETEAVRLYAAYRDRTTSLYLALRAMPIFKYTPFSIVDLRELLAIKGLIDFDDIDDRFGIPSHTKRKPGVVSRRVGNKNIRRRLERREAHA